MGFRLMVEEYCYKCPSFEADVQNGGYYCSDGEILFTTDTRIKCKYDDKCKIIKHCLEKQLKGDNDETE